MLIPTLLFLPLTLAAWYAPTNFTPCSGTVSSQPTADLPPEQYNALQLSRGYLSRLNYLKSLNNTDLFKFNFNPALASATASKGAGGLAVLANRGTMPALVGSGVAMALGFLEPCGVNAPHYHPFATQLVAVVSGGPLKAGAIWDNAAPSQQLHVTVNTWEMVTLPQGSIHYVFNDNCLPAVTANAFSSDDPGILNVAPTLFKFDEEILNGTLGWPEELDGERVGGFGRGIPPSYVLGSEECLRRCGIGKDRVGTPP